MLSIFLTFLTTFICLIGGFCYFSTRKPLNFPPGPKWLPMVGNALELRREAKRLNGETFVYEKWSKDYNSPIVGMKLGKDVFVVVLNYSLIQEVNTSPNFNARPDNFFLRLRTMGVKRGITLTDGDFNNEQRNFVLRHLREVGYGRRPMEAQIEKELENIVCTVSENGLKPMWPGLMFPSKVLNVLWNLVAGEILDKGEGRGRLERLTDLMARRSKVFGMTGGTLSHMPWLRYVAPEWSGFNLINRFNTELSELLLETIKTHKADFEDEKASDDLIYAYLKEMQKQQKVNPSTNFTELQLTMIILDLLIAGLSTVQVTMDIAVMTLVLYPEIQKRLHEEIDFILTGPPTHVDRSRLPYTEAFLTEVHRFYSMFPLGGLRRALEDYTIGGYTIPKNATVLTGLRTVHMNDNHWGDPEVFRPERFLDENMEIVNTEHVVTFGSGRRKCLGEQLARNCLFIFFAGILQRFTVELPPREEGHPRPDPNLVGGISFAPKQYKVIFRPKTLNFN